MSANVADRKSGMNTVGKILVVFITACSLGFVAFVSALRNGGPDWKSEVRSPELQKEFVFTFEQGEKPTFSSKHRRSEQSVIDKTPILAEAVLKSRKRLEEDANKKFQELSPQPQLIQDAIKKQMELIPIDKQGVEVREQNFNQLIQQLWTDMQSVGNQFSELTVQTQEVLREAQLRREEGYRLANQVELLRNDKFAAIEQQKVLEDELIRLEENKRRLDRRKNQLKQQLGDSY